MKNKKIVLFSVIALIFVVCALIVFCVIVPQSAPMSGSSHQSSIMIDKTQAATSPSDKNDSDNFESNTGSDEETQTPEIENNGDEITAPETDSSDENQNETTDGSDSDVPPDDIQSEENESSENEDGKQSNDEQTNDEQTSTDDQIDATQPSTTPDDAGNQNSSNGSSENLNDESTNPFLQNLNFYVNEKAITKTKQVSGNVTTFEISFRVFVLNNSTGTKTISSNAFSADYFAGSGALYYTTICDSNVRSVELGSFESADFGFTLKYVVFDTENFDINNTNNLSISYMFNEVISLTI